MTSATSSDPHSQTAVANPGDATARAGTESPHQRRVVVFWAVVRTLLTVALVVAIYFLVPFDHGMNDATAAGLALGVLLLAAIVAVQVWRISRSKYPTVRAVEALAFTIPLYILVFASTYYLMERAQPASFGVHLSRTDAMYFSTTVFTTVGFGDISAKNEAARVVVTLQMALDLLVLGLVVRLTLNAIKLGQQRHATSDA